MLGFDVEGFGDTVEEETGFNFGSAAAGAGFGMMFGGPVGAAIGGAIGGLFFAEGGIVSEPTMGVVGEAGPEAVIPIEKIDGIIASSMQKASNGIGANTHSVTIQGGIHIGAGNNVNKHDVQDALDRAFVNMISNKRMGSAVRGVI